MDGSITLDIPGIVHMQLMTQSLDNDFWISNRLGNYSYRLPLTIDINPHRRSTWNLTDEPLVLPPNTAAQEPLADQAEAT